jgi:hypothetical protein
MTDLGSSRSILNQKEVLELKVNLKQSWRTKSGLSSFKKERFRTPRYEKTVSNTTANA